MHRSDNFWVDEQIRNSWKDGFRNERMDIWMDIWMEGWVYGWLDGKMTSAGHH